MSRLSFKGLDTQLKRHADQLRDEVKLTAFEADKVATLVASEVRFLESSAKAEIVNASPVPLFNRIEEPVAFQSWMSWSSRINGNPALTRAQVITQNYMCFVYLPEACFRALRSSAKSTSVTKRCCKFLTDNPVRSSRNAIAHSNWTYTADFDGLIYWARRGEGQAEIFAKFEVSQSTLDFWQALSKGVAYAASLTLDSVGH